MELCSVTVVISTDEPRLWSGSNESKFRAGGVLLLVVRQIPESEEAQRQVVGQRLVVLGLDAQGNSSNLGRPGISQRHLLQVASRRLP